MQSRNPEGYLWHPTSQAQFQSRNSPESNPEYRASNKGNPGSRKTYLAAFISGSNAKSSSAFHILSYESRILWVNKSNTKSQKKTFSGDPKQFCQASPKSFLTLNFRHFFNLSCITLAGSRDYFLVSVTTHDGLYPFQGRNLISHVSASAFRFA